MYIVKVNALNHLTGEFRCASKQEVAGIIYTVFGGEYRKYAKPLLLSLANRGYVRYDNGAISIEAIPVKED